MINSINMINMTNMRNMMNSGSMINRGNMINSGNMIYSGNMKNSESRQALYIRRQVKKLVNGASQSEAEFDKLVNVIGRV